MNPKLSPVLFVDDEQQLHNLMDGVLEDLPITMSHALTGKQGQEMVKDMPEFAVILSNHNMGEGLSGVDFFKWVKKNSPKTIRILITGGIDEYSLKKMVTDDDINDYAIKPVIIDSLINQVNAGLLAYNAA